MPSHRTTPAAYQLLHRGMEALAKMSADGMRVDKGYLDAAIAKGEAQVADMIRQIACDPISVPWKNRFREKTNYLSADQLSEVVFGNGKDYSGMGFKPRRMTEKKKRASADEASFVHVQEEVPIIKLLFAAKKVANAVNTFLVGIRREAVQNLGDGCWYVHPEYGLNTTITHRSSSFNPNLQNQPNRNPVMAEMVRRTYIPRPGNHLLEIDLGQHEGRIMCPVTGDPVLTEYILSPNSDMHRDMAAQIFKCEPSQVSKGLRQLVKGDFVFASFYGSYWGLTGPALWEGVDDPGNPVRMADGTPARAHLTRLGFTELGHVEGGDPAPGTWCAHMRDIDRDFWGRRFKVYAQWRRDTFDQYLEDGGFMMATGFAVNMLGLDKKQICNAKVQGPAFHVLLRALPLINGWLRKYKFNTRTICEVHDSALFCGSPRERDDVVDMVTHYLTTDAVREWGWITVPLVCEPELCPVDQPWYEKASLSKGSDGLWVPSDLNKWAEKYGDWSLQLGM